MRLPGEGLWLAAAWPLLLVYLAGLGLVRLWKWGRKKQARVRGRRPRRAGSGQERRGPAVVDSRRFGGRHPRRPSARRQ